MILDTAPAVLVEEGLPVLIPQANRSPGWHLSFILSDLCVRLGHITADSKPPKVKMELGSALEHALAHRLSLQFPSRYFRKWDAVVGRWENGLELERDEVYGTIDLLDLWDWCIEDVKYTSLSARHDQDSPKLWKFWMQVKSYCAMFGEGVIPRLRLIHSQGDYGESNDAIARLWERRCSERELEGVWERILRHRDLMIKEGITPERMAA